jgi:hypothetical protein
MYKGNLVVCSECVNLVKELEGYVWDSKKAGRGEDEPLKGSGVLDHACDALRYAIATHKVPKVSDYDARTLGNKGYGKI